MNDIDDDFAKVLTKIYSRLIFEFAKGLKDRASIPFHIVLEEAHRYIQSDHDRFLFGYNIFERIAKEGRKYGVILGLISQRPVEISDTVISQCTNFLIFKINHPMDVDYIRKMVPHITNEIIEKQKSLQAGTCLGFGLGFKIPLIVRMKMPDPAPLSGNCDVVNIWCGPGSAPAPQQQVPVSNSGISSGATAPVQSIQNPPAESTTLVIPKAPQAEVIASAPVSEVVVPETTPQEVSVPTQQAPEQPVSPPVAEKFDDSFVVMTPASETNNNQVVDPNANTPIQEIAEVNINAQGMLESDVVPKTDSGEPLLELVDDDDDDNNPDDF